MNGSGDVKKRKVRLSEVRVFSLLVLSLPLWITALVFGAIGLCVIGVFCWLNERLEGIPILGFIASCFMIAAFCISYPFLTFSYTVNTSWVFHGSRLLDPIIKCDDEAINFVTFWSIDSYS